MKDKPKAGLIINWLGREAAQVLKSMEVEAEKPDEVFEALEKIFRPESNQTLVRFRFRSMKQSQHQSIDDYMSKLRLALPECKYKNDADELLKDQFLFGVYNKEIQDHLLGEISETDNSVKALYDAKKIESKHEQCKLLGIVNPNSLTTIDAIKHTFSREGKLYDFCGRNHKKGKKNCPAFGKICDKCGGKNHFKNVCKSDKMYANLINLDPAEGVDQTEIGHIGPRVNVPTDVIFMKLIAVMTAPRIVLRVQMWMIWLIRFRVYFIIEIFGGPGDK